ncbi:regulator of hemoglobinization and erythroid cell expansion protein isoform X3 [Gopherus evgoodei]|uniref:regulator of hemoglobinization and erythroid cell expansion protein isoform X3 n=1 Tax=Gopherus evgoodei TaxID=1825980 RepID=UPI0011D03541|nr:regulator of hemoglobinization and erythroid cell expansion protein isoform X3 [Gopherus evgoodei]
MQRKREGSAGKGGMRKSCGDNKQPERESSARIWFAQPFQCQRILLQCCGCYCWLRNQPCYICYDHFHIHRRSGSDPVFRYSCGRRNGMKAGEDQCWLGLELDWMQFGRRALLLDSVMGKGLRFGSDGARTLACYS